MGIFRLQQELSTIEPETVFYIGAFPVKNSFLTLVLLTIAFVGLAIWTQKKASLRPGKLQSTMELLYEKMFELVSGITGKNKHAHRIFPIIAALLLFILLSNSMGLVPGLDALTFNGTSVFRAPTTDFNTTFGLAFAMLVLVQLASIKHYGVIGYFERFFQIRRVYRAFRNNAKEGMTAVIEFFIGILDIVSEIAKVVSLSLRLFGNMYAGQILATLILGALAIALPAVWLAMNVLTAVIHSIVFALLVAAYYVMAVEIGDEVDEHELN
ncbi:MAG: FoF1 ATP synthase subunit a [Candidatus Spechtbacterales bacterium]|nr:FoF1 ATP synthase subunit a [Candidatus Spechtbacterales bacterium]